MASIFATAALLAVMELGLRGLGVGADYWDRGLPPNVMRDPDLWARLRPSSRHQTKESGLVAISSHGTRGPDFEVPKPRGTWRAIAVGDSVTFGWGVSEQEAYPALLQQIWSRDAPTPVQVINAGQPSHTSFQGLILLRRELLTFDPDLVLWCFGHNDAFSSARSDVDQSDYDRTWLPRAQRLLRRSRIYTGLTMLLKGEETPTGVFRGGLGSPDATIPRVSVPEFGDNLRRAAETCREAGVELAVLTQPRWSGKPFPYNDEARRVAQELGLTVVDLERRFAEVPPAGLFVDNVHPSPSGHRLFAEAVAKAVGPGLSVDGSGGS